MDLRALKHPRDLLRFAEYDDAVWGRLQHKRPGGRHQDRKLAKILAVFSSNVHFVKLNILRRLTSGFLESLQRASARPGDWPVQNWLGGYDIEKYA